MNQNKRNNNYKYKYQNYNKYWSKLKMIMNK